VTQNKVYNICSLGAGVQSTAMLLMAEKGLFDDKLDACVFSDVGAEPKSVYDHLDWLETQVSIPIHRIMHKDGLTNQIIRGCADKTRVSNPPFYTLSEEGKVGMLRRGCTYDFKVVPVTTKVKRLIGVEKYQRVGKELRAIQWMGISYDEIQRMRESKEPWTKFRYPLIENKITRQDCLDWMKENGYPTPPRSACTYCPYHSDREWLRIKNEDQESWNDAVEMDRRIRNGMSSVRDKLFLHKSCKPLDEVEFKTNEDLDQQTFNFGNECEGMCGL
jgi:hypothetical protein